MSTPSLSNIVRAQFQHTWPLSIAIFCVFCVALPWTAQAGQNPQVDLSVSVSMTPATFVPGGSNTFTVTVYNAGPDAAGTSGFGNILVFGDSYFLPTLPPPYELIVPVLDGECSIERFVTEPLPDGTNGLIFVYYFGAIPADESRSCTSGIEFYLSTQESFTTSWELYSGLNNDDTNPANDITTYVFRLRPTSIPASSPLALIALVLGIGAAALWCRKRATTRY